MPQEHTIIIIVGPTAIGKTAMAIDVAKHFNTEIISADSRQCYRELNIGVAKPSEIELNAVQHHFINTHSIQDSVNAVVFEQYALTAAEDIFKQHQIAVMVGGTGLYIKAFCEGFDEIPEIPIEIRNEIIANYNLYGIEWLQNELKENDIKFWQTAEQYNPQRLMRALEVIKSTGTSIVDFRSNLKCKRNFNIIKIGLELERETLYQRINNRVELMMEEGLLDEVKSLMPHKHINALQTVGYKELFEHIEGKVSLKDAVENIKKNTRHYAKRQMTWFKKDPNVNCISSATFEKTISTIQQQLLQIH